MKKTITLSVVLMFFVCASCATIEEHKGAATGATIGAATGGLIGVAAAPAGKGLGGAIIGGLTGGILGGVIGHYAFDTKRDQADTNSAYGYRDNSVAVRVETVNVSPHRVRPGDKIDLNMTYAVLTQGNEMVSVRETREIWYGNSMWGNPETTISRQGGTYASGVPVFLPTNAQKGIYKVRYIVETGRSRDSRESEFTVY